MRCINVRRFCSIKWMLWLALLLLLQQYIHTNQEPCGSANLPGEWHEIKGQTKNKKDPRMSADAIQRRESQWGSMTCRIWCLGSSSSSRWPLLVPIQSMAALGKSRAFTVAKEGDASEGSSASLPCPPLSRLQGTEGISMQLLLCGKLSEFWKQTDNSHLQFSCSVNVLAKCSVMFGVFSKSHVNFKPWAALHHLLTFVSDPGVLILTVYSVSVCS